MQCSLLMKEGVVNNFYNNDEIMLALAYRQVEDKQRWAAQRRLAQAVQGRRPLRRRLGLMLTAWGQDLLASSLEVPDEQMVTATH